jgi:hypothetical protein
MNLLAPGTARARNRNLSDLKSPSQRKVNVVTGVPAGIVTRAIRLDRSLLGNHQYQTETLKKKRKSFQRRSFSE